MRTENCHRTSAGQRLHGAVESCAHTGLVEHKQLLDLRVRDGGGELGAVEGDRVLEQAHSVAAAVRVGEADEGRVRLCTRDKLESCGASSAQPSSGDEEADACVRMGPRRAGWMLCAKVTRESREHGMAKEKNLRLGGSDSCVGGKELVRESNGRDIPRDSARDLLEGRDGAGRRVALVGEQADLVVQLLRTRLHRRLVLCVLLVLSLLACVDAKMNPESVATIG